MKKTFIKTVFRDLKKNISRFIAIIAIVALGVGFLIGLLSATPDLQHSLDVFYNETNTYDIQIKSTIGFRKEDVEDLKKEITSIDEIESFYQMDLEIQRNGISISARVIEQTFEEKINQLKLISGHLPTNDNECIVLNKGIYYNQNVLGETITIENKDYEIVGIGESAVYYYKLMEPTQIGTGNLDAIYYLPKSHNTITDIVLTIKDASSKNTFSKDYLKMIEPICQNLEDKEKEYIEKRIEALKKEAIDEGLINAYDEVRNTLSFNGLSTDAIDSYLELNKEMIEQSVYAKVNEEFAKLDGSWYVLNRKSNTSYVSFKDNSNKVNDVAIVFPFFFFFIAGLIALTSITRMVSEDRSSIGTLKSLGFSNSAIVKKYLFYALFACIIGVLIGIFSGVYILPIVIYVCYNSLFVMPTAHYLWNPIIILVSSLSMCLTIVIVMLLLCIKTLKEKPNALMVPKAPKAGKRILLEKIGFVWSRLTFRFKSALRNVFRFKRNLIMMIVGVGGCTALMLVAFGLKNSMHTFSKYQFDEILKYDLIISSEETVDLSMLNDSTTLPFYKDKIKVDDYEIHCYYTKDEIVDYLNLGVNTLPNNGVLVSKQIASKLKYKKGETIEILGEKYQVAGVFDNYIDNYIIIPKQIDKANAIFVKFGKEDSQNYDEIIKEIHANLLSNQTIENIRQTRKNYDSMSDNISIIINVIILCSGALAVIVIYNLTNINIQERIKEIATLKVIGYQRFEVLSYIYKEILIMSIFGILFGFVLGPMLDYFVMDRISSPGTYLSLGLSWEHFIYSCLITIFFVLIVFLLFIPKVKNIKMVESLKSVE